MWWTQNFLSVNLIENYFLSLTWFEKNIYMYSEKDLFDILALKKSIAPESATFYIHVYSYDQFPNMCLDK